MVEGRPNAVACAEGSGSSVSAFVPLVRARRRRRRRGDSWMMKGWQQFRTPG